MALVPQHRVETRRVAGARPPYVRLVDIAQRVHVLGIDADVWRVQARTQGVFQTVQTLVQIVGAVGGGAMFAVSPTLAFLAITAVCLLGAGTALVPRMVHARQATGTP